MTRIVEAVASFTVYATVDFACFGVWKLLTVQDERADFTLPDSMLALNEEYGQCEGKGVILAWRMGKSRNLFDNMGGNRPALSKNLWAILERAVGSTWCVEDLEEGGHV